MLSIYSLCMYLHDMSIHMIITIQTIISIEKDLS